MRINNHWVTESLQYYETFWLHIVISLSNTTWAKSHEWGSIPQGIVYMFYVCCVLEWMGNGPLARYVKLRVAHAPGMPGTFSPPQRVCDPDMHYGTCVTHVPRCMPGSLTSGFLWSRWRGKLSRHSQRMRNPQFYVTGKRPMVCHQCYFTGIAAILWVNR